MSYDPPSETDKLCDIESSLDALNESLKMICKLLGVMVCQRCKDRVEGSCVNCPANLDDDDEEE